MIVEVFERQVLNRELDMASDYDMQDAEKVLVSVIHRIAIRQKNTFIGWPARFAFCTVHFGPKSKILFQVLPRPFLACDWEDTCVITMVEKVANAVLQSVCDLIALYRT